MRRLREIFDAAADLMGAARLEFLDSACGGDVALRKEVDLLLEADEGSGDFLASPSIDSVQAFTATVELKEGERVGPYRLLEQIGEGAHATVYVVEQQQPIRRRAAMKVIKLGMDTREVIARFENERQALAMMEHPNIAKVFDAGATSTGRPYFVMELVKGVPITDYCDLNQLTTRERLELFVTVCQALQHAHLKGVIHRDVKPSNILVTLHDGVPVPKVIDFGIAKAIEARLVDRTFYTRFHQFIGTPAYMSPEQAEMSGLDVDTRSDVYSLGVLLYELLAGSTPFDGKELLESGYSEIQRVIREEEPPAPSTRLNTLEKEGLTAVAKHRRMQAGDLGAVVRGDLDWIVMKALEKDRTRRYQTAVEFARDVERHLRDEPVEAGAPGRVYRLAKFVRRHRSAVLASTVVVCSLVGGLLIAGFALRAAVDDAADAKRQAEKADGVIALLDRMLQSASPDSAKGEGFTVRQLLDEFSSDFAGRLEIEPEVEMTVRRTVGSAYEGLGDYVQAEPHLWRAHGLAVEVFGESSPEAMVTLAQLGWVAHQLESDETALAHLERAGRVQSEVLGETHADYLRTQGYLASLKLEMRALDEAEVLAEAVIGATPPGSGPEGKARRRWMTRILARVYHEQGREEEAERLFATLVDAAGVKGGSGDPYTLDAIHALAGIHAERGELEEAARLVEKGLRIAERTLGPKHRMTLLLRGDRALIDWRGGRSAEAQRGYAEVLEQQRLYLGDGNQDTVRTMLAIAGMLLEMERFAEAEAFAEEAFARSSGARGEGHHLAIESLSELAETILRQRRYADAEQLLEVGCRLAEKAFRAEHPTAELCARRLAGVYVEQGKWHEAEAIYRRLLEQRRKADGEGGVGALEAQLELVRFLKRMGRYAEALESGEELLGRWRGLDGERGDGLLAVEREIGILQRLRGVPGTALRHLEEAYRLALVRSGGAEDEVSLGILLEQGLSHEMRHDYKRAGEVLSGALSEARAALEVGHRLTAELEAAKEELEQVVDDHAKIAERARAVYEERRESLGERHGRTLLGLNRLIETLMLVPGAEEEVGSLVERDLELSREVYGEGDTQTLVAMHLQALVADVQRDDERVDGFFQAVIDAAAEVVPPTHQRMMTTHFEWSESLYERDQMSKADIVLDRWIDTWQETSWPEEETEVLLPRRSRWSFRKLAGEEGSRRHGWRTAMDEGELPGTWYSGLAPFGYGIAAPGTMPLINGDRQAYATTLFQRTFEVEDPGRYSLLKVRLRRSEGAVVFLNGAEILRSNVAANAGLESRAEASKWAVSKNAHYVYVGVPVLLKKGRNAIAVELHQASKAGSEMAFDLELQARRKTTE